MDENVCICLLNLRGSKSNLKSTSIWYSMIFLWILCREIFEIASRNAGMPCTRSAHEDCQHLPWWTHRHQSVDSWRLDSGDSGGRRLDEVDELVLQNKLLQVPNEVRKLQEYDIIWRHFLHGKFLPLFSFGFVISICSISLGLKTGIIAGAAMDVVENEAPFFFRSRNREGGVWLESGWSLVGVWTFWINMDHHWWITDHYHSWYIMVIMVVILFAAGNVEIWSDTIARNFSNSCIDDDNISVLLRMPNVILTPHLAFFTREPSLFQSGSLTVQCANLVQQSSSCRIP